MKFLLKKIMSFLLPKILFPLRAIPVKEKIILVQTHSRYRYGGNPRYVFERLSSYPNVLVYWITESPEIMAYLKKKNLLFLSNKKIFTKMFITLKADFVVDSGTNYYNFLNLLPKKAMKLSTMHGSGPKLTMERHENFQRTLKALADFNQFDFVSFCTNHAAQMVGKNQFLLHSKKMAFLGSPKTDDFYNKSKVLEKKVERPLLRKILKESFSEKAFYIYYVPTFRPYPYPLPLFNLDGFEASKWEEYLEKRNIHFIYSHHSKSGFTADLSENKRIHFFSYKRFPLMDNNQLLLEMDLLMGDFSTMATDFAILKRPQIFVVPDYKKMEEVKGFAENLYPFLPGPIVKTSQDLFKKIDEFLGNDDLYKSVYGEKVENLLEKYAGPPQENAAERTAEFILEKLKKRDPYSPTTK